MKKKIVFLTILSFLISFILLTIYCLGISSISHINVSVINLIILLIDAVRLPVVKAISQVVICLAYIITLIVMLKNIIVSIRDIKELFVRKDKGYMESVVLDLKNAQCENISLILIFLFTQSLLIDMNLNLRGVIFLVLGLLLVAFYEGVALFVREEKVDKKSATIEIIRHFCLGLVILLLLNYIKFYSLDACIYETAKARAIPEVSYSVIEKVVYFIQQIAEVVLAIIYFRLALAYTYTQEFSKFHKVKNSNLMLKLPKGVLIVSIIVFVIRCVRAVIGSLSYYDFSFLTLFNSVRNDYLPLVILSVVTLVLSLIKKKEETTETLQKQKTKEYTVNVQPVPNVYVQTPTYQQSVPKVVEMPAYQPPVQAEVKPPVEIVVETEPVVEVVPTYAPLVEEQPESWFCPMCGKQNFANFCGRCGTKKPE